MFKKLIVALLVAGGLIGATYAAAASITVNTSEIGAGGNTVSTCQTTALDVTYTTAYDASVAGYIVDDVIVTDVSNGCDGDKLTIQLTTTSNAALGTAAFVTIDETTNTGTEAVDFLTQKKLVFDLKDIHVLIQP